MAAPKQVTSVILDGPGLEQAIERIASEIVARNGGTDRLALIGIRTRGEFLARRIQHRIESVENVRVPIGILDVSFYRDDTRAKLRQPVVQSTDIAFDLTDRNLVLVDDVLYTGRSVRAALDEIMDFGRPARIQLAVLIDRGHRELPIQPDYVGRVTATQQDEKVRVRMKEHDGEDSVVLWKDEEVR